MGCDGGTIPKRDELVRTKKKQEQKDKTSELNFRWRCCSISQAPLQKPIVACGLGKLYSKDAVINGLLDRSILPESAQHLKSLKDIRELMLTVNPAFQLQEEKGDGYVDHQSSPYICPIIGLEMNGKFNFCFAWTCGCVVSERAIKQLKSPLCHKCQKPVSESDLVVLNASDSDLDLMRVRLESRQARARAERKAKRAAAATTAAATTAAATTAAATTAAATTAAATTAAATTAAATTVAVTTAADTTAAAKVKEEPRDDEPSTSACVKQEPPTPSHRSAPSHLKTKSNPKLAFSSAGTKRPESLGMQAPDLKKAKSDYSVAKDPQASDVYKSLFTSSNKAKKQHRAHWVTYNPFYN